LKVLVIGTGNMGSALARRLSRENDIEVFLWNRTPSKAVALAKEINARVVKTIIEGIQQVDVAISLVSDDEALLGVVSQIPRADGLLFINSSTINPVTSKTVSGYLESRGVCYVEAPIIGGPSTLLNSTAIIILSGKSHCKMASKNLLGRVANKIIDLGEEPEKAQALKLTYNSLLITSIEALAEAILIAEAYGISYKDIEEVFKGTVFEQFTNKYLSRFREERRRASFRLQLAAKDLYDALIAGKNKGLGTPLIATSLSIYTLASSYGFENEDYTKIYAFLKSKNVNT
jgi:3-hydroxyisobutyrate dehydrogenase